MTKYKFGDVVLIDFPQSGTTQLKRRPALVVLDIRDADIVLAPITTVERVGKGDHIITEWKESGLLKKSWVRLAKINCLSKCDISKTLGRLMHNDKNIIVSVWNILYSFAK